MNTDAISLLLTETFHVPSDSVYAYSDEGASLLETLALLSAAEASKTIVPGGTTIAAHADHVRFFTAFVLGRMRGDNEQVDWDLSWAVREVDDAQWIAIQEQLRNTYLEFKNHLLEHDDFDILNERRAMAIVVHAAYHVGAIRQMVIARRTLISRDPQSS